MKILKGVRLNLRSFRPGQEAELAEVITPEQFQHLKKTGCIAGDFEGSASGEVTGVESTPEPSGPSALETGLLDAIRTHISGDDASPFQTIDRIVRERDEARTNAADIADGAEESERVLRAQIAELEGKLEAAGGESTPVDPFALVKSLGADAVGSLVKAGLDSPAAVAGATDKQLEDLPGIGKATVAKIRELLK